MNRYKSTTRWRKESTGIYLSPCGHYRAEHVGNHWNLLRQHPEGWVWDSRHLSLADCQEIAAKYERGPRIVQWDITEGFRQAQL